MTKAGGSTVAPRHSRRVSCGKRGRRTEGTGAPRPNLKKTVRPSGKVELPHAPLKEAVQAAKAT